VTAAHFTATVEVTKITRTPPPTSGYPRGEQPRETRATAAVSRLVIRADSLDTLRAKLGAHVELLED